MTTPPPPRDGAATPVAHVDGDVVKPYLEKTRWFGGKGRPFRVTGVRRVGRLGAGDPTVDVLLVELTYDDATPDAADRVELYQVPLSYYTEAEHRIDYAFVGWWEDPELGWVHAYDALHDRSATHLYLEAFGATDPASPSQVGGLGFHRMPGHDLDPESVGSLFTGEQSNSSVAFGEDAVMKLFRKVTPGPNPDITTHEVLTRSASPDVAHLYGWVEGVDPASGEVLHLGMLQEFLRTASDGWELALSSVRTLFAEEDTRARESGGDFSGESARLGDTLREIHQLLRQHFEVGTVEASFVAGQMNARLDGALLAAPVLAPHEPALRSLYGRLADLGDVTVQRVHGDLHLGQTLRTSLGWKIVDFEGEPAKPLAERLLPDSPWRDVAGMLRSFDYAPHAVERQAEEVDEEGAADRRARAAEWAERNQRYFLTAYAEGDLTDEQRLLVDAYTADKAVYETVYETRNRPGWVEIPLTAVARIGA